MGEHSNGSSSPFDPERLKKFNRSELVYIILEMQKEKNELKNELNKLADVSNRVIELKRSHALYLQYSRRNCIEISGIPADIEQRNLEDEVIKIYDEIKCEGSREIS